MPKASRHSQTAEIIRALIRPLQDPQLSKLFCKAYGFPTAGLFIRKSSLFDLYADL